MRAVSLSLSVLCVVGLCATSPPALAKKRTLAVMRLVDRTRSVTAADLQALGDAMRTRLAQGGRFLVIDQSRQAQALRRMIKSKKRESYRHCYDTRCQIPLGKALAADTILRAQLTRVGSSYVINAELIDLAKEAATGAAQVTVAAEPRAGRLDRLLMGVKAVAIQLTGGGDVEGAVVELPRPGSRPPVGAPPVGGRMLEEEGANVQPVVARERRRAWQKKRAALVTQRREALQRAALQRQEQLQRQRWGRGARLRRTYGWTLLLSAGLGASLGIVGLVGAANTEDADAASSPSALREAADQADSKRLTGIIFLGASALALGLGAYLLFSIPEAPKPLKLGGLELDPLPQASVASGALALGLGGRF